jgi:hypothetical protein
MGGVLCMFLVALKVDWLQTASATSCNTHVELAAMHLAHIVSVRAHLQRPLQRLATAQGISSAPHQWQVALSCLCCSALLAPRLLASACQCAVLPVPQRQVQLHMLRLHQRGALLALPGAGVVALRSESTHSTGLARMSTAVSVPEDVQLLALPGAGVVALWSDGTQHTGSAQISTG